MEAFNAGVSIPNSAGVTQIVQGANIAEQLFKILDRNSDGVITRSELSPVRFAGISLPQNSAGLPAPYAYGQRSNSPHGSNAGGSLGASSRTPMNGQVSTPGGTYSRMGPSQLGSWQIPHMHAQPIYTGQLGQQRTQQLTTLHQQATMLSGFPLVSMGSEHTSNSDSHSPILRPLTSLATSNATTASSWPAQPLGAGPPQISAGTLLMSGRTASPGRKPSSPHKGHNHEFPTSRSLSQSPTGYGESVAAPSAREAEQAEELAKLRLLLSKQTSDHDEEVSQMREMLGQRSAALEQLQGVLAQSQSASTEQGNRTVSQIDDLQKEVNRLRAICAEQEALLGQQQSQEDERSARTIEDLQNELARLRAVCAEQEAAIIELTRQIEALQSEQSRYVGDMNVPQLRIAPETPMSGRSEMQSESNRTPPALSTTDSPVITSSPERFNGSASASARAPQERSAIPRPSNSSTRVSTGTSERSSAIPGRPAAKAAGKAKAKAKSTAGSSASSRASRTVEAPQEAPAVRRGVPPGTIPKITDGELDEVDVLMKKHFEMHPHHCVGVEKVRKGWYVFDEPINKRVFVKLAGKDKIIVRVGGGYQPLGKFIAEHGLDPHYTEHLLHHHQEAA